MERSKILILPVLLLSILHLGVTIKIDPDPLRYSLCNEDIEWAVISSHGKNHSITVQLKPTATKKFAEITGNNIGHHMELLYENEIVVSTEIETRIPNGRIGIKVNSKREAKKLRKELLKSTPNQQCGIIN